MNAPLIRPSNDRQGDRLAPQNGDVLAGIARHVSREGCQFVMTGKAPSVGRRLRVMMESGACVSGTIRWVLGERVGFAFDRAIDEAEVAGLTYHFAGVRVIELLPEHPEN
jgi:hypothetical protein